MNKANETQYEANQCIQRELKNVQAKYELAIALSGKKYINYNIAEKTGLFHSALSGYAGPKKLTDIPELQIALGLVAPESATSAIAMFSEINSWAPCGCFQLKLQDCDEHEYRWFNSEYKTVFDENGAPVCCLIALEDVTEQRKNALLALMYRRSIERLPFDEVSYYEFNLEKDVCEYSYGGTNMQSGLCCGSWDEMIKYYISILVHPSYKVQSWELFCRTNVIKNYKIGQTLTVFEFPSAVEDSVIWYKIDVGVQCDCFSRNLHASFLLQSLDKERSEILQRDRYIEQLKTELESSRLKIAMGQMQPHFLYNALSSIRTIIKVDPDYAYDLVFDFATHLRSCIKAMSSDEPISFKNELLNIKAYLNIEKIRFGQRLKVNFDIGCENFKIPPLSVQPIVENAVQHGIFNRGKAGGTVTIKSRKSPNAYIVEVIDDGVGFDMNEVLNSSKDCVGIKNTLFRFECLMNAKVNINSIPNEGTRVEITIPENEAI